VIRPRAAVLLTGSELLRGVISDRNAPFLSAQLERMGFELRRTLIVGDAFSDVVAAVRELSAEVDLLVTSGGLGPTHDDRTVAAVAEAAGVQLQLDEAVLAKITEWTSGRAQRGGLDASRFAAGNRKQAMVPVTADVIGLAGTAPGLVMPVGSAYAVILPGVPSELRRLWQDVPGMQPLQGLFGRLSPRRQIFLRTYGIGESHVADLFEDAGGDSPGVETSICARDFEIEIDIRYEPAAADRAEALAAGMRKRLGDYLFVEDHRPVAEIVLDQCRALGWRLATAESCTGGRVAAALTAVPGSSDAFVGGVVSYSNELKQALLGVSAASLAEFGAVSPEVAREMADGARERLGADVAVSVTGVAGPGGGTPDKPVGLVFVHVSSSAGELQRRIEWPSEREQVQIRATVAALHLLRAHLASVS
jgi:nicotinamide-nucleotide amidase